ncbi:MAG: hypothetical protein AAF039_15815 [Bacteroidota bacterium]
MALQIRMAKPSLHTIIDVVVHYFVAVWIMVLLYFLLNLREWFHGNAWLLCAGIALLIVPIRLLALHLLRVQERDKYIKKIMDELVNDNPKP